MVNLRTPDEEGDVGAITEEKPETSEVAGFVRELVEKRFEELDKNLLLYFDTMYPPKDEESSAAEAATASKASTYNVPKVGLLHVPLTVNNQNGYSYLLSINNQVYVFCAEDLGETANFGGISGKRTDWPISSMQPWPGHHAYLLDAPLESIIDPNRRVEEPDEITKEFQPLIGAWSNNSPDMFRQELRKIQDSEMNVAPASAEAMLLRSMAGAAVDNWKPGDRAEAMKQWNISALLDMVGYDRQLERILLECKNVKLNKINELKLW